MNRAKYLSFMITFLMSHSVYSEDLDCTAISKVSENTIKDVTLKYNGVFAEQKTSIEDASKKLADGAPNPNGFEATVNFDVIFTDHIREFILDIPEITMKTQNMSMDLPQVTMKTQTWSWDMPEVIMHEECHGGLDELVWEDNTCHNDFPSFDYPCPELRTRRGPDICYSIPSVRNVRNEVKLDVPEVKMDRAEWAMDVPEITMKQQVIKINIPDIEFKPVDQEIAAHKEEADNLSRRAKSSSDAIAAALKSEVNAVSEKAVDDTFTCQKNLLKSKIRESYNQISNMESTILASYNRAKEVKANELITSYENTLNSLKDSKKKMLIEYRAASKNLTMQQKDAMNKINVKEE